MESFNLVDKQEAQESQAIKSEADNYKQEFQCQQETERRKSQDEERGSCKNIDDQQQDQKEIIEKDQQNYNKLYFLGVNSILLNLLSNLYIQEKLLIIIILNLSTYIALYRMKNLKNNFTKQFNFLNSISSNLSSKVKELQSQFNYKEKITKERNIKTQSIEQNKQEDTSEQQFYQEIIKKIQNMNNQHNQHNQLKIGLQEQLKQKQNRFQKQFNQLIRDQDNQLKVYKNCFEEKLQKLIQQYRYISPFRLIKLKQIQKLLGIITKISNIKEQLIIELSEI
ncbi:hypothetical protein ABPG74_018442 [Tetrahymena malaccensis]